MLVKPNVEILGAVTFTDLFKNCGDSGDKSDKLKSLDNNCHQHAKQYVTAVINWPIEARQEFEERTKQLPADKSTLAYLRELGAHIAVAPDHNLCLSDLTTLPQKTIDKIIDLCRQHKPKLIAELQQETAASGLNQKKEGNPQHQVTLPKSCVIHYGVCELEVDHGLQCHECGVNNHLSGCTIPDCPIWPFKNVTIIIKP